MPLINNRYTDPDLPGRWVEVRIIEGSAAVYVVRGDYTGYAKYFGEVAAGNQLDLLALCADMIEWENYRGRNAAPRR